MDAKEEIARLLEKHRADYLKGDADAWASLYAEDAVFSGRMQRLEGRPAIRDYFVKVFEEYPTRTAPVSQTLVRVYNEGPTGTAVLNVYNDAERVDTSGQKVMLHVSESLVFVKVHGQWLIVNHHASPREWPSAK